MQDAEGNAVEGIEVTFTTEGGSLTGSPALTGADGIARLESWTLSPIAGENTLVASAAGLGEVSFTASGIPGAAATMVVQAGKTRPRRRAVPWRFPGRACAGRRGNAVEGVEVTFTTEGGSVTGSPALTGADGIARLESWTLSPIAGENTLVASAAGLGEVSFAASGIPGAAATMVVQAGKTRPRRRAVPWRFLRPCWCRTPKGMRSRASRSPSPPKAAA
ncbi:hypothetical protein ACFSHQ_07120 [Gemmobacter lanyuensis]